jgi:pimeloyl-ACP methyl ester carboxylesterase
MRRRPTLISVVVVALATSLVVAWRRSGSPFNTLESEQCADDDSQFIDVRGLRVHVKTFGHGSPTLVLLHGFVASTFTWNKVVPQLSNVGTVIAFDRPAYGLTSRPIDGNWQEPNPYDLDGQADLTVQLLDHFGVERAILVGHSAGGTVAMCTALRYPERVASLVLVAPAVYAELPPPFWLRPLLDLRAIRRVAPFVVHALARASKPIMDRTWHDPSGITPETVEGYLRPFHVKDWGKSMLEVARANCPHNLVSRLAALTLPTLVITGDDDHVVPTKQSLRLAHELLNAQLLVIPDCGHIPQEEKPEAFLTAVLGFIADHAAD